MPSDIRPGDVLAHHYHSSKQYVFGVGQSLYADYRPSDDDGEPRYPDMPYGTFLVSLELGNMNAWYVADHYGDGSIEDGREWRRRWLEESVPTPERIADPQWRRDHGYVGEV